MKTTKTLLLLPAFVLASYSSLATAATNQAMDAITDYCNQMAQDGLPESEMQSMIQECIEEQTLYLSEAPSDAETLCYQEVDERVANAPEDASQDELDYEALFDKCMEKRK